MTIKVAGTDGPVTSAQAEVLFGQLPGGFVKGFSPVRDPGNASKVSVPAWEAHLGGFWVSDDAVSIEHGTFSGTGSRWDLAYVQITPAIPAYNPAAPTVPAGSGAYRIESSSTPQGAWDQAFTGLSPNVRRFPLYMAKVTPTGINALSPLAAPVDTVMRLNATAELPFVAPDGTLATRGNQVLVYRSGRWHSQDVRLETATTSLPFPTQAIAKMPTPGVDEPLLKVSFDVLRRVEVSWTALIFQDGDVRPPGVAMMTHRGVNLSTGNRVHSECVGIRDLNNHLYRTPAIQRTGDGFRKETTWSGSKVMSLPSSRYTFGLYLAPTNDLSVLADARFLAGTTLSVKELQ